MEIEAAQAKMDVLRVSGSNVEGIRCNKSDGMDPSVARGVCPEADSFVPGGQGTNESTSQSLKPSERKTTVDARSRIIQQRSPGLLMAPNVNSDTISSAQFAASPHVQMPVV